MGGKGLAPSTADAEQAVAHSKRDAELERQFWQCHRIRQEPNRGLGA